MTPAKLIKRLVARVSGVFQQPFITGTAMILVFLPPAAPDLLRWTWIYPPVHAFRTNGKHTEAAARLKEMNGGKAKGTPSRCYWQRASHWNGPKMLRSAKSDAPCVLTVLSRLNSEICKETGELFALGVASNMLTLHTIVTFNTRDWGELPEYVWPLEFDGQNDALRSGNILLLSKRAHFKGKNPSSITFQMFSVIIWLFVWVFFSPVAQRQRPFLRCYPIAPKQRFLIRGHIFRFQAHAPMKNTSHRLWSVF